MLCAFGPMAAPIRGLDSCSLSGADEKLGTTKADITRNTEKHPQALDEYREALSDEDKGPMPDDVLAEQIGAEIENPRDILEEMRAVAPGRPGATLYHRCVAVARGRESFVMPGPFESIAHAADTHGCDPGTVYNHIKRGNLTAFKLPGRRGHYVEISEAARVLGERQRYASFGPDAKVRDLSNVVADFKVVE